MEQLGSALMAVNTTMAVITISPHLKKLHNYLFLLIAISLTGCFSGETETTVEAVVLESHNNGVDSLHTSAACSTPTCAGEDCLASGCHRGDANNIIFGVSGTVFQRQDLNLAYRDTAASIQFYSGPGGSGELIKTLEVDAYGNFYSTEPLTIAVYPALRDVYDENGLTTKVRYNYMPRPVVPTIIGTCNFCHSLAQPELSVINDPENPAKYIRINNGITSSAGSDLTYHDTFASDPGPDCLQSTCHGTGSVYPVFTMAGLVVNESENPYDLGDAAIGLFPQECDDVRVDANDVPLFACQTGVAPENVVPRTQTPKTFLEINRRGHFYTTQPIDWTIDTYPTLANYNEGVVCRNIQYMPHDANQPLPDGNCFSCHDGITTAAISISGPANPAQQCAL